MGAEALATREADTFVPRILRSALAYEWKPCLMVSVHLGEPWSQSSARVPLRRPMVAAPGARARAPHSSAREARRRRDTGACPGPQPCRSSSATAYAEMPSPRPAKPMPSLVVALTLTQPVGMPSASASRRHISG